ncbi:unnamed protein product [Rotaria sordida]|uniref:poly(ADP-ribose) glycohydrolase n=1 Tax=Rotaria sordida TaxID=392033 RepID=A0A819R2W3_9BILA|nr:unnamed protein product [Rotaria sordida]
MSDRSNDIRQYIKYDDHVASPRRRTELNDRMNNADVAHDKISKGTPLTMIIDAYHQPPQMIDMEKVQKDKYTLMISPFRYDQLYPNHEPRPINDGHYIDRWNKNYVRMPCSPCYTLGKNRQPIWTMISNQLANLRKKCDNKIATVEDLKTTIEFCTGHHYDMYCLETLINKVYTNSERIHFMSIVLSTICSLALNVDRICSRSPPLLRIGTTHSVTMSQLQAASLLACAFFCLFPYRSNNEQNDEYENFQDPNFNQLYRYGPPQKIEKLKCILHYFRRITNKMPIGVITFKRYSLPDNSYPNWSSSIARLCDMHLTTGKKIEDVKYTLQVDFANKYIGGGVLGSGCVQEEIRFTICPEMLVSLLLCEKMEINECIFLIGCERYSTYKGYANSFQFDGNYEDKTLKYNQNRDNWGQKWCHLVAMDAFCFRDPIVQYDMKYVKRELIKAYTSFYPQTMKFERANMFGIATGNWGCGAFNGDRQLKAIIQLMAASEAGRPLIYAAYLDKNLVKSFFEVYEYLLKQQATVRDLYRYLKRYSTENNQRSLFEYILKTSISSLKS